ncbi:dna rna polymerases superfamily protein [Ceraceosorus bombacis]|uniref:Dna rna polymerases superfamily protein n=1 Tax=Ceraceosorus bombacis TaxID=401625 RepID=A0A0P1BR38_9BASI|nr:dna rna polymerases superfamily protein [Ceraceosorus bombacis]
MKIVYCQGRVHSNVDPLSRAALPLPDNEPETNNISSAPLVEDELKFHNLVRKQIANCKATQSLIQALPTNSSPVPAHLTAFTIHNGLLLRIHPVTGGKTLVVPSGVIKGVDLRLQILQDFHDAPLSGHLGVSKTYQRIIHTYWWPSLWKDVKEYVISCASCQRNKASNQQLAGQLQPLAIPPHRWHTVSIDFTGPFPTDANGNNTLMVIVDKLTKRAHFVATKSTATAVDIAKLFFREVVRLHGMPSVIVSDRDTRFTSLFWTALCKGMGTKLAMSTAFHPQTDGQTECLNRVIKEMIRHYISYRQDNWSEHLNTLEYAYNDSVQASTGRTPFELDLGYHPASPLRPIGQANEQITPSSVEDFAQDLQASALAAADAIADAHIAQARNYNKKKSNKTFNVGDLVKLSSRHVHPNFDHRRKSRKLLPKYYGPYKILARITPNSYRLELPAPLQIHNVINIQHLAPFHAMPQRFAQRREKPPPPVKLMDRKNTSLRRYWINAVTEVHANIW